MVRLTPLAACLAFALTGALGCDRGPEPPAEEAAATSAATEATAQPSPHAEPHAERQPPPQGGRAPTVNPDAPQLAGLRWSADAPLTWRAPSRPMRNAEYVVNAGEAEAVLTIFHFPGMGGSIEENVARWTGQFRNGPEPEVQSETIGGLEVTTIDASGTFASSMGMGGGEPVSDSRLLGAIVQAPDGPVFFKLLGPAPTVTEAEGAFAALVQSFEPTR